MKIAIVIPKLTCGGTERTAVELANYCVSKGINVTIMLMHKEVKFYGINPDVNLVEPSVYKRKIGKLIYPFFIIYFLRTRLKKVEPDIVLALGYIVYTLFSSLFIRTKVIISFRSSPNRVRFPNNRVLNLLYKFSHWIIKDRVDGMIAQTTMALEIYNRRYNCPIVVIPNFLRDLKKYEIAKQNQIVNVGHCSFEKGQHYLIKAFAELDAPDWKLVIVGDGPKRMELQGLSELLGVSDRVIFTGYRKDVDFFLAQSKIFASTSIIEGYPNALIEAMATPLPAVCFNCVSGPSDIIVDGENGFLIKVGDIQAFAVKLQELIDQPKLRERIQKKAIEIKYDNDISKIAPKYLEFFSEIVGE